MTRVELDLIAANGCSTAGCTKNYHELVLVQKCHPKSGLRLRYFQKTGTLQVFCRKCGDFVAAIEVANPLEAK